LQAQWETPKAAFRQEVCCLDFFALLFWLGTTSGLERALTYFSLAWCCIVETLNSSVERVVEELVMAS